jgi:DNA (cytosine-5)-methyltransferase 1
MWINSIFYRVFLNFLTILTIIKEYIVVLIFKLMKNNNNKKTKEFYEDMKSDNLACVTHYMDNQKFGDYFAEFYKKEAIHILNSSTNTKYDLNQIESPRVEDKLAQYELFRNHQNIPFPSPNNPKFTFIDLFAGIGGFRIALQNLAGRCVFTSEWDQQAQKTYYTNFGDFPFGDITTENVKSFIPDNFDILCAGFPCQAFSIAGKRGGFEDTRGTLFFDVAEIIKRKQPKAIFLENVKGLNNHDKGKTLSTILNVLRNDLGYFVPEPKVMNAKNFGVPQNRERIFIVGFRNDLDINNFNYPEPLQTNITFNDVKEKQPVSVKYYLSETYLNTLVKHKERHASKGNGFGFEIIPDDGTANAVVCGGMGRERNLVIDDRIEDYTPVTRIKGEVNKVGIRKMTPREWARLQGFPDNYIIPVADASAYKQFGNSVAVPAIQAMANEIIKKIL